jgi:hypothetical protein
MNSAALRFVPVADLEAQGYGKYRSLFETADTTNADTTNADTTNADTSNVDTTNTEENAS